MIIPKPINLIKDDFSDFTPYQGATVEVNKTFPIEVFKGGRNLMLRSRKNWKLGSNSSGVTQELLSNGDIRFNKTASIGNWTTGFITGMPSTLSGINSLPVGTVYAVIIKLKSSSNKIPRFYTAAADGGYKELINIGNGYYAQTYTRASTNIDPHFQLTTLSVGDYFDLESMKWVVGTDITQVWSPAPEDGYDYQGIDGAYHIKTSGGTVNAKFLYLSGAIDPNTILNYRGKVKNLNPNVDMYWRNVVCPNIGIVGNEIHEIGCTSRQGDTLAQYQFCATEVDQSLDFIASSPSIYDGKSIESFNILDIIQSPVIDIENKSLTVLGDNADLSEQFISFKMSTEGSLYTRNMRMVEIELHGKHDLMNKWVHIQRYVANYNVDNGNLQTIDYGHFGIVKQEYDDTTNKTRLVAYDKMILTQIPYNSETMNLTYPLTVSQVIHRLAIVCNLDLVVNTTDNIYELVQSDVWANQSFTYADILEHVAQLTGSMFSIIDNKLTLHKPQEYDFTIQGKFNNLKMNDKYGKANILNISQEPQHYNNYQPDNALDIPLNDRVELVFINNPIFSFDPTYWKRKVFPLVNNVEYQTFNSSALGYGIFDVGDIVNVYEHGTNTTYKTMITKETFTNKHSVVTEIESHKPFAYKGQYVVETDQKRQGQETYFIVDQQNGVIEGLIREYNDLNDKTAQLRIDVDSITTKVENIHLGNLIPNFNMYDLDMTGWDGVGNNLLYVSDLRYYTGLRYSHSALPVRLDYAMSGFGLSFFEKGEMISPIGHRLPRDKFSWKGKINNFSPFTVKVYEYDSSMTLLKTTPLNFNNNVVTHELSLVPHNETQFFRIGFIVNNASVTNRVQLYDMMFNANEPQDWFESANDVMVYAQTQIKQVNNQIDLQVQEISSLSGDIHNAGVEINAVDGVTTYGKKFEVMSEDRSETYMRVTDEGLYVQGNIEAGSVGNFKINNGVMEYTSPLYERQYSYADLSAIKDIIMTGRTPTAYELFIYDFNKDGSITTNDYQRLNLYFQGTQPKPPYAMIQSQVRMGTNNGQLITRTLYNNGTVGLETIIQADNVKTGTIEVKGMSFDGKSVEVDSNNFLKLV